MASYLKFYEPNEKRNLQKILLIVNSRLGFPRVLLSTMDEQ